MTNTVYYLLRAEEGTWVAQSLNHEIARAGSSPDFALANLRETLALAGVVGQLVDVAELDESEIALLASDGHLLPLKKSRETFIEGIDLGRLEDQPEVPMGAMSEEDYRKYIAEGMGGMCK